MSGVATLFSEEFYTRIVRHLKPGGIPTQWLQLYELEPKLLASVLKAILEKTFDEYTLFSTDNDNILIVARLGQPIGPLSGEVFEFKAFKMSCADTRINNVNVLELYRIANRQALSPLMASFDGYANSDYFSFRMRMPRVPASCVNRRMRSSTWQTFPSPRLSILGRHMPFTKNWLDESFPHQQTASSALTGVERALRAVSIGRRLKGVDDAAPEPMPSLLIRAVETARKGLIECREGSLAEGIASIPVAYRLAITAYWDPATLKPLWNQFKTSSCAERSWPKRGSG